MKNIIEIRNTIDGLKQGSENYSILLDIFIKNHLATLVLIGEFNPFTFKIITAREVLTIAILLSFCMSYSYFVLFVSCCLPLLY